MNSPGNKVFCDTSFFFAALCPEDTNHARAGDILEACVERGAVLHTTWDIISETVTLLRYRKDYRTAVKFLEAIRPVLAIVRYDDSVRAEAERVFKLHARDNRLSFCDALSFVVVTRLLGHVPCLTFDRDFRRLGLPVYPE